MLLARSKGYHHCAETVVEQAPFAEKVGDWKMLAVHFDLITLEQASYLPEASVAFMG
jgi:hypothetical protein